LTIIIGSCRAAAAIVKLSTQHRVLALCQPDIVTLYKSTNSAILRKPCARWVGANQKGGAQTAAAPAFMPNKLHEAQKAATTLWSIAKANLKASLQTAVWRGI
jgi:hypothetical protein